MSQFDNIELVDCHSHTYLSGHGEGTVGELVSSAAAKGVTTLVITEHLTLPQSVDPKHEFSMPRNLLQIYLDEIALANETLPGMQVIPGFEVDWRANCEEFVTPMLKGAVVILGSVHMLHDDWCFDDPSQIEGWTHRSPDAVWAEYFELWMQACSSSVPFTTMSHPDLVKKFGIWPSKALNLQKIYNDAAALAAEHGRMIEVNTAGWYKEVGEQYPSVEFLREFCRAGVDCMVGADAHRPQDVARDIRRAYAVMYEAGYRQVAVPTPDGDRRYLQL